MYKNILVTGFKPFQGESLNPSELLLPELSAAYPEVETLTLPVSYQNAFKVLQSQWQKHGGYDALVMMGQAGGRKAVCLERVAINWAETSNADEDRFRPPLAPLVQNAPPSYIVDFFPSQWKEHLTQIAPTEISLSAGAFVCNAIYFQALHTFGKKMPILFVHLPYLPEQTLNKPEMPSMSLETQKKIMIELLRLIKNGADQNV